MKVRDIPLGNAFEILNPNGMVKRFEFIQIHGGALNTASWVVGRVDPNEEANDLGPIGLKHPKKCARTVCQNEGQFRHLQNGELYCISCARKINDLNRCDFDGKDLIPIVRMP